MSDSNNAAALSAIFNPDESTTGESVFATHGEEKEAISDLDVRSQKKIEADYKSGARDKKTVCAWMAYRAALIVCKGQPSRPSPTGDNDRFNELLMEGYQAAVRRWNAAYAPYVNPDTAPDEKARKAIKKANVLRYDASKDRGNGIPGLVYTAAQGRMRNAAQELFTAHGKRKHDKDDVLPMVSVVADLEPRIARDRRSPATAPKAAGAYATADSFSNKAKGRGRIARLWGHDAGGIYDAAVTAAADKAAQTKPSQTAATTKASKEKPDSTLIDSNASRVTRDAAEIHVQQLLAMLPNKEDRKIITQYWGLEGRANSMTIEELAEYSGQSEKTMRNRLEKLLIELQLLSPRRPRQSAWRAVSEELR